MTFALVLLDLDWTLVDSAPGILDCFEHVFGSLGYPVPPRDVLAADIGPPLTSVARRHGVPEPLLDDAVALYRACYVEHGAAASTPYPGVLDVLRSLADAPGAVAIATMKRTDNADAVVQAHGLGQWIDLVGGAAPDRPDKERIIEWCLSELGVSPADAVMVGDRRYDIIGGRAAGTATVGVTWGYGTTDELASAGADHVVDTPAQLLDLLVSGR